MKINFQEIKNIVDSIFSSNGYSIKNLNVQFPEPLSIKVIRKKDNSLDLTFSDLLPKVTWQRFIKLSASIVGITLGEKGGTLKLKYLPDINFMYDDTASEQLFGNELDLSDIEQDIYLEYPDEERQFLAKRCLHYAAEWATIANQAYDLKSVSEAQKKKLKKDCKKFVMENLRNDPEIHAGSVVLTFLLFYVVLPVVLKFLLERLFKKLFNN